MLTTQAHIFVPGVPGTGSEGSSRWGWELELELKLTWMTWVGLGFAWTYLDHALKTNTGCGAAPSPILQVT
jgi:hypothetical protein